MDINKKTPAIAPPLSPEERERLARQIEEGANKPGKPLRAAAPSGKFKILPLRLPIELLNNLEEIKLYTGLTMTATCLEILRPAIKQKLKEAKEQFEDK